MPKAEELQNKLDKAMKPLARKRTAKGVAKFLQKQGIKGRSGSPWSCPVAVYISRETGCCREFDNLSVGPHDAGICVGNDEAVYVFPKAVSNFITEFDRGKHQELAIT